jgi:hypothetical protein
MDDIPAFFPVTDPYVGDLVLSSESSVLGHPDDVELSLVWMDGELQEILPSTPDFDHHWAEVDLPILLTRGAAKFHV